MEPIRLSMAGPSGTGKTTLAKWIAEQYNIPFIETSTKPLWEKLGITSHKDIIDRGLKDPAWGLDFQYQVLQFRRDAIKGHISFVTDRSPLDNMAYFLMQNTHLVTERETELYAKACGAALSQYNSIIAIPFTDLIQLEDDGMRVSNKYHQQMTNKAFEVASTMLHTDLALLKGLTLKMWDMNERKVKVVELLQKLIEPTNEG